MRFAITRRGFISYSGMVAAAGSTLLMRGIRQDDQTVQPADSQAHDTQTALPPNLVHRFVRAAHLNLEQTEEMLKAEPRLIRAAWEWGPGDFEMGIDGAAHSGAREIVTYLLEHGAPYSIFAAATLGDLNSVTAMVERFPEIVHTTGAHEISLIEHALAGGEAAEDVVAFLRDRGAVPREKPKDLPTTDEYRQRVIGNYQLSAQGREVEFRIYTEGDQLFIDAGRMGIQRLQYQGQDIFQLEGTPAQIIFEHGDQRAIGALIREGAPIGRAVRKN